MTPHLRRLIAFAAALLALATFSPAAASPQSPENQVFQFMATGTRSDWSDGGKTSATAYLWVPEKTRRLRGLLILGTNVPEQRIAGDAEIRAVAAAHDLGIVWASPTFMNFKVKNEDRTVVAFLQQLLDELARTSGYDEVSTVPWLPIGESGHLLMVDALVEAAPERCIAGVWLKNPHLPPHNRTVPAFVIYGTAQEWGQDKNDYATHWQDTSFYDHVLDVRRASPDWPLTAMIDGNSGHFDVSAELMHLLARYIDSVATARLPAKEGDPLRSIDLHRGFAASLPVSGRARTAPIPYASLPPAERALPWFFDRAAAESAIAMAGIDWKAGSQLVGFVDGSGNVAPFSLNGISAITPKMDPDGVTFHLKPILLDRQPANFLHAGAPLDKGPSAPVLEWMCGAVVPAGGDALRFSMDRGYRQQAIYFVGRAPGSATVRASVQPVHIEIPPNTKGTPQTIDFRPIADVPASTRSLTLRATATSGLPVRFFVVAGPAVVEGNTLRFTAIPPRAKLPLAVTVAAWQWGRSAEPRIRTAEKVVQTFHLK